jgi:CheY-specific phosphatase CheX
MIARNPMDEVHHKPRAARLRSLIIAGANLSVLIGVIIGIVSGALEWRHRIQTSMQTVQTWVESREQHDKAEQRALAEIKAQNEELRLRIDLLTRTLNKRAMTQSR